MNNRNDFQENIDNIIEVGKKLIICCQSSNEVLRQDKRLRELFPQRAIRHYTGDGDDNKKTYDFSDVCRSWLEYDVIIYSPAVESGINFDVPGVFDNLLFILSSKSNAPRCPHQMMARVRHFKSKTRNYLNNDQFLYNKISTSGPVKKRKTYYILLMLKIAGVTTRCSIRIVFFTKLRC